MRSAGFGVLFGIGVIVAALACGLPAQAQRTGPPGDRIPEGQLIALPFAAGETQQVTIVDPKTRVMAVYHVDKATGALALRSVRNVHWDLLMEEYNTSSGSPTPRDIRALAEQR